MRAFDWRVTVMQMTTAHDHFAEVFAVVTDQVCVLKDWTAFESVAISWWDTCDDGANNAWFVEFAGLLLNCVDSCIEGMCNCFVIV